jgi:uncharacterized repeat protein (TIGR03837 family)
MRWDLFCRVIDNLGDAGVAWRLAADLASRGERVRLWIDDVSPLARLAPAGAPGVEVLHWAADAPAHVPGDVVVELFGCEPPATFVGAMAAAPRPPVWVNLEYLSAEPYVERSHGLPSPQQHGPGRGLTRWFFYPGFTPRTGGLLREPGLLAARAGFDRAAWLSAHGITPMPGERLVSLFCYPTAPWPVLLQALAPTPTLLLLAAGAVQQPVGRSAMPPGVRVHALPWLAQPDFDRLLWSCDLNFVRGEDSLVRATWAGAPFVWQVYPQHDGAHAAKLEAFLARFDAACPAGSEMPPALARLFRSWNGLADGPLQLPAADAWQACTRAWRDALAARPDLGTQLRSWVQQRQAAGW